MQDQKQIHQIDFQKKPINNQNSRKQVINHWPDSRSPQWSRQAFITVSFGVDWITGHKTKGSHHHLFCRV